MLERYRFSKSECPICYGKHSGCSGWLAENGAKGIHCGEETPPSGWRMRVGESRWNTFYANTDETQEQRDRAFEGAGRVECAGGSNHNGDGAQISYGVNLSERARGDAANLLALFNPVENKSSVAYQDLSKRGLSDSVIRAYDFIDLSGFTAPDSERWTWFSKDEQRKIAHYGNSLFGLKWLQQIRADEDAPPVNRFYVPSYSYDGTANGWQARLYPDLLEWIKSQGNKPAKYVWLPESSHKHPNGHSVSSHLPKYGELPITILKSTEAQCDVVILTEGILKPLILYERLGRKVSVIGASGGNFTSAPKMLGGILAALQLDYGTKTVCLGADAGSAINPDVQREYEKAERFVKACGFEWHILDWGQLETKEGQQDIDEIDPQIILNLLPPKRYELIDKLSRFALTHMLQNKPLNIDYSAGKLSTPSTYSGNVSIGATNINMVETEDQLLSIYESGAKYILDRRPMGSGKAMPLNEPVLTPNGWKPIGSLKVGDSVVGRDGLPTTVIQLHPQGEQDIYKVTFTDGTYTHCTLDHLWTVQNGVSGKSRRNKEYSTYSTADLISKGICKKNGQPKWYLPGISPCEHSRKLDIDGYILGALLGDGSTLQKQTPSLYCADIEIVERCQTGLPTGVYLDYRQGIQYQFTTRKRRYGSNPITKALKRYGVYGKRSYEKEIPDEVLTASKGCRLAVLQGLMDTDGSNHGRNAARLEVTSKRLRDTAGDLVRSLGGEVVGAFDRQPRATNLSKAPRRIYSLTFRLPKDLNPFSLKRKACKYYPTISAELRPELCRYRSNGYKLTHNSHAIPKIKPLSETGKVFAVMLSPRNPPTQAIEEGFVESPSRHGGLYAREGSYTPAGKPVYLRPRDDEHYENLSAANCARAEEHILAIKQGFSGNTLCQTCPYFTECSVGVGQYDYLYQKILANDAQQVRIALSGINPNSITQDDTIIIDEPPSSAPFCEEYRISLDNSSYYLNQLEHALHCGISLVERGDSLSFSFTDPTITAAHLYEVAANIDEVITKKAMEAYRRTNSVNLLGSFKAGCVEFISTVLDERAKIRQEGDSELVAVRPNMRLRQIAENAGKVIYLDATAEPVVFAAQYGLPPEELVVIDQEDQAVSKVQIEVLAADDFNSRRKGGIKKKEKIQEIKRALKAKHSNNIGFLAHSDYCEPGDIIFFSESRGSNKFAKREAICMFGLPQLDLGAIQIQWSMVEGILGSHMSFQDYYNYCTHSEIKQCIGRLRGFRREKQETPFMAYIVANVRLNKLIAEGYKVKYSLASMVCDIPIEGHELFEEDPVHDTLENLCQYVDSISQNRVAALTKLNLTLSKLRRMVLESDKVAQYGEFIAIPDELFEFGMSAQEMNTKQLCQEVLKIPFNLCVLTARIVANGGWPQGLPYESVRLLRLALAYRLKGLWYGGRSSVILDFAKHGYQTEEPERPLVLGENILRKLEKHFVSRV